jgi:hypothetical protein
MSSTIYCGDDGYGEGGIYRIRKKLGKRPATRKKYRIASRKKFIEAFKRRGMGADAKKYWKVEEQEPVYMDLRKKSSFFPYESHSEIYGTLNKPKKARKTKARKTKAKKSKAKKTRKTKKVSGGGFGNPWLNFLNANMSKRRANEDYRSFVSRVAKIYRSKY